VWNDREQRSIRAALSGTYPYAYSAIDFTSNATATAPACSQDVAVTFGTCFATNCGTLISGHSSSEVLGCAFTQCTSQVALTLSPFSCYNCIVLAVVAGVSDAITYCATDMSEKYTYTHGLMMLSKQPLTNVEIHPLPSFDFLRGYIYAETTINSVPTGIVCTHLTSILADYPGTLGQTWKSYEEENHGQVQIISDWYASKTIQNKLWAGDMNHGPGLPGILESAPLAYTLALSSGWDSHFPSSEPFPQRSQCTWCVDNPEARLSDLTTQVLDHIYTKGFADGVLGAGSKTTITRTRVFDDFFNGYYASDHYGLKLTIEVLPTCSDGIKNQDEVNTDCGGVCEVCPCVCNSGADVLSKLLVIFILALLNAI